MRGNPLIFLPVAHAGYGIGIHIWETNANRVYRQCRGGFFLRLSRCRRAWDVVDLVTIQDMGVYITDDGDDLIERLLSSLNDIDLSHTNPMWRYYSMSDEERSANGLAGLELYLPDDEGGNRDIGSFQGGLMRLGAKHNDIYPILGDMIRWKLKLPSRRKSGTALPEAA